MKDLVQIWNHVSNRRYSGVNTSDRELKEIPNNRFKKSDIDTFEANFAECEGLNSKFNDDIDFNNKKDAIINRLFERRKQGQIGRQPKCLFILLMLGFISLLGGFFVLFGHPYDFLFKQKVVLQDGGEIFEMWRKPEVELYCRIFLFNITNAEEYMAGTDNKLKLKEVGPYVYREQFEHDVTSFNENGTLSSIPRHPLVWVEEMSEGNKENDTLYLPHIALLSIANVVSKKNYFTRLGLNNLIGLTNSQPLAKMTAREFMMGYKSELMSLGNTFLPGWITFDKLGLIDRMYDFNGDYETIFTGERDVRESGLTDTYRGSTHLPQWEGEHCSNVQYASDGVKFKGGVNKTDEQIFYRKSLCRAARMIPTDEGVRNGLKAYKYTFPEHMMDNGKYDEKNKCYCREGRCLPDGMLDVTDCYYGFPIALSYPHFYQGEDVLFSKVEGLEPNQEKHETRFWVEPESGLPLDVSAKFQINMALGDISSIRNTERFSNMYLPMLWFDIRMYELPLPMEQRFKLYLNILPVVEQAAMYLLFLGGAVLILLTVYILTFKVMFKTFNKQKNLDSWLENKKTKDIYSPCEIPLDTDSDEDLKVDVERGSLFGDLKDFSHKLTDKMYDTVGSVKEMAVKDINVRNIFDRRGSVKKEEQNAGFKSDSSSDERNFGYKAVNQTDSEDECKYLEVLDDGTDFARSSDRKQPSANTERSEKLNKLDSVDSHLILHISD